MTEGTHSVSGDVDGNRIRSLTDVVSIMRAGPDTFADALCRFADPEIFYPGNRSSGWYTLEEARRICAKCPVQPECLRYAVTSFTYDADYGIWAGTTRRQRDVIRRLARYGYDVRTVVYRWLAGGDVALRKELKRCESVHGKLSEQRNRVRMMVRRRGAGGTRGLITASHGR